jgi:hypothetical protein
VEAPSVVKEPIRKASAMAALVSSSTSGSGDGGNDWFGFGLASPLSVPVRPVDFCAATLSLSGAEVNGKKGQLPRMVTVIAEGNYAESSSSRPSNPDFLREWRCTCRALDDGVYRRPWHSD